MYSWGDNTTNWKKPGGYNYNSARKPYLDKLAYDASKRGPRAYNIPSGPNRKLVDVHGKEITSNAENAAIIMVDGTGSMVDWPGEFFDRVPLIYQTLSQYKQDLEICFAVIGDAYCDEYPIQVNEFGKGITLEDHIKALYPEGGGGGQIKETYELFGYFISQHCKLPNAKFPFLFMFGDEKFYDKVNKDQIEYYIGDKLQEDVNSENLWRELSQKYNVFFLQKPYGRGDDKETNKEVADKWGKAIGKERVIPLPSPERAVDVAMGIMAKYWGQFGDFTKNIGARQDSDQIKLVMRSIKYLPKDPNKPITRKSRMLTGDTGDESKKLI